MTQKPTSTEPDHAREPAEAAEDAEAPAGKAGSRAAATGRAGRGGQQLPARARPRLESQVSSGVSVRGGRKDRHVRGRLGEFLEANYDRLEEFFAAALGAEKQAWGRCDGCRKTVMVDVPDWAARNKVVETMLNQGFGRPQPEEGESRAGFVLRRVLVLPDGAELVSDDVGEGGV